MKIEYELTRDDWAAFGEHCARTAPEFQKARHVGVVAGMLPILAWGLWLSLRRDSFAALVIAMIVAVAWGLYWPRRLVANVRSLMLKRDGLCVSGRHVLDAQPEGLSGKCDLVETLVRWPGIRAVVDNGEHVFVMLSNTQGYVVPRARVTSGDIDEFVRELRSHRERAGASFGDG